MAAEWIWNAGVSDADKIRIRLAAEREHDEIVRRIGPPPPNWEGSGPWPTKTRFNSYAHPALDDFLAHGHYKKFDSFTDKLGKAFGIAVGGAVGIGAISAVAAGGLGSSIGSAFSSAGSSIAGAASSAGGSLSAVGGVVGTASKGLALFQAVKAKLSAAKGGGTPSYEEPPGLTEQATGSPSAVPIVLALVGAGAAAYLLLGRK